MRGLKDGRQIWRFTTLSALLAESVHTIHGGANAAAVACCSAKVYVSVDWERRGRTKIFTAAAGRLAVDGRRVEAYKHPTACAYSRTSPHRSAAALRTFGCAGRYPATRRSTLIAQRQHPTRIGAELTTANSPRPLRQPHFANVVRRLS